MKPVVASYRLQLRQGVDFDRAVELLPYIAGLGVSQRATSPARASAKVRGARTCEVGVP